MQRDFDVVLLGATGFTGALVAEELARRAPATVKLALAGRNANKLAAVKHGLGAAGSRFEVVVADSGDAAAMERLARSTKVVCTTVGPYAKFGLPLVEACARAGTHVCDLTGEPLFIRRSIDVANETAKASGARIVHCCGFDSIPSDLGLFSLHSFVRSRGASGAFRRATLLVLRAKGGFSGGTITSLLESVETASVDRDARRVLFDPYGLSPDRAKEADLGQQRDQRGFQFDPFVEVWTAPFVMESINTRVVRRTNALLGYPYGRELRYRETMAMVGRKGVMAGVVLTAAVGALISAQRSPFTKKLVAKVLPKAGEGPSQAVRESGFFKMRLEAETVEGERVHALIAGTADPGYGETAKMLTQSALCLAMDELPKVAGVLTPATAMGSVLLERLRGVGMTFEPRAGAR